MNLKNEIFIHKFYKFYHKNYYKSNYKNFNKVRIIYLK